MNTTIKIIVVEDKAEEIERAYTACKKIFPRLQKSSEAATRFDKSLGMHGLSEEGNLIQVSIYSNLHDFFHGGLLDTPSDYANVIVLTDLHFPHMEGVHESACGISVLCRCAKKGIPVAVVTQEEHHNAPYLHDVWRLLSEEEQRGVVLSTQKNWQVALELLLDSTPPEE